jgi:elongation factor P--(R)-beta-lysine ligase
MDHSKKQHLWANLLKSTRSYLDEQGFLEVTTPCLVPAGAFEASIDPLRVEGGGQLHTSPEMEMKVTLSLSAQPIYQLAPCFRDDPESPIHRREFTMLEFYRLGADCTPLIAQTQALFEFVHGAALPWSRLQVKDLFLRLGLDLSKLTHRNQLQERIEELEITSTHESDTWSDLFFRVWLEKIEPHFDPNQAVIVEGYPTAVSPLTRAGSDPLFADRFEIYWHGMELCNGCSELRDADLLIERWKIQNQDRAARGVIAHPFPERLHGALSRGLPDCAGVAIGMDRLLLALARQRGYAGNALL